jgi:hypothetical protein
MQRFACYHPGVTERRNSTRNRDYLAWLDILVTRVRFKIENSKIGRPSEESYYALKWALEALAAVKESFLAGRPWPTAAQGLSKKDKWPEKSELRSHFERLEREYQGALWKRRKQTSIKP